VYLLQIEAQNHPSKAAQVASKRDGGWNLVA